MAGKPDKLEAVESIEWSDCHPVEVVPERMPSSRVPASPIVECAELGETPEDIAEDYRLGIADLKAVLAYANERSDLALVR